MSMATRTDMQSPALHVGDSHDLIRVQGRAREQPQGRQRRDPEAPPDDQRASETARLTDETLHR